MRLRIPLLLAAALVLAACGDSPDPTTRAHPSADPAVAADALVGPTAVARAFLDAARRGHGGDMHALLTDAAAEGLASGGGAFTPAEGLESFELGVTEVTGTEARVPVDATMRGEAQSLTLRLREVDAGWRVWGFDVALGDELLTIDLEDLGAMFGVVESELASALGESLDEAFAELERGGSAEEIAAERARFEAVGALDAAAFDAGWRVDVDWQGTPAVAAVQELLEGTGVALDAGDLAAELARPVTLALRGVSRLEALEALARELELAPVYPSEHAWDGPPAVGFRRGPRTRPVAFAGPFLVEVAALEENAPHTTGAITIAVEALGLPEEVLAYQTEMAESFVVGSLTDGAGRSLLEQEGTSYYGTPTVRGGWFAERTTLALQGLLRGTTHVDLRGAVRLSWASRVEPVRWAADETGTKAVAGCELSVTAWAASTRFELRGAGVEGLRVRCAADGPGGAPLGVLYQDGSAWNDVLRASVNTPEPPTAVELKVCREERLEVAFDLLRIPLEQWVNQPVEQAPLRFGGEQPVEVTFGSILERGDFPKVSVQVANGANKDAVEARATFVYRDERGEELEEFSHVLTGAFGFEGQEPLAPAGTTQELETTAFFMPEATRSLRIRIEEVTFLDGTKWERP